MFNRDEYGQTLINNLSNATFASGGDEIVCGCMYCEMGPKGHHFYISIPKNDEVSQFHCKLCGAGGYVTHRRLTEWGIYDINIGVAITKYNNRVLKLSKNHKYVTSETTYNMKPEPIIEDDFTKKKIAYINNRLGLNLTNQELINNKIILNLRNLLDYNNIHEYTRAPGVIQQLNDYFVGFLSADNAYVNLRTLVKNANIDKVLIHTIAKRYVNYNIFGKMDNTRKFYISPVNIDITKPNPVEIHIAEGGFDILSIKYNLRKEFTNSIYASINGSGYINLCKYCIKDLGLINCIFHIYPDKDISDEKMFYLADILAPFSIPIYIHRNIMPGEKDFGVPLDRINEYIQKII